MSPASPTNAPAEELRITAADRPEFLELSALWQHRDLLMLLVRREWITKYSQTVLGPLWFIAQPLVTTAVFVVVFSKVARVPTDDSPPLLFYLCGMIPWNYFAQTFNGSSTALTANAGLFGKVYFPRMIVPLSGAISNVLMLGVQLLLFVIVWGVLRVNGTVLPLPSAWATVFLPLIVVQVGAIALGSGLLMASLTVRYRDLAHVSAFLVGIWFYLTPIVFPLSAVPERFRWLAALNPMTFPVEFFRAALLPPVRLDASVALISLVFTVVLFVAGLASFQRVQRTFIDSV